ncbi:fimbrial protein [Serratia marcescens]|uniref:fimbrial protein n=1 Tax=Serratia marcescens TaxID=615 RepID=UPI0021784D70|nr:fimbrial protein [Serratia marcescens]CAI1137703.1 Minor fimbrial protein prsF precursor [Serratia marcescens]CAI1145972.1 Minor fimbrial protein prsF precursor [Serratia marcescens]CAI1998977.1 Minor fimbrial protein prsF precursor [Serratia marcescens]
MHGILRLLLLSVLAVFPPIVTAFTTVNVRVAVVVPPPCVINDGNPILVDFEEVMTTRIDGNNYRKKVNYTLSCTGVTSLLVKLRLVGNGAGFDSTLLGTSVDGLGIELLQGNNIKLPLNGWVNFMYMRPPELWAVPVKRDGAVLKGGVFYAAATMELAYQ